MSEQPNTTPGMLPPSRSLLRSIAIATGLAAFVLMVVVLPAEYGIDPTRIGSVIGLTHMGRAKMELAVTVAANEAEAAARRDAPGTQVDTTSFATNTHKVRITLLPNEGREIKLLMHAGARTTYAWSTGGAVVKFVTHGEPLEGSRSVFERYGHAPAATSDQGVIIAAFEGLHGWFWRNNTSKDIVVTLETDGQYENIRILDNAALEASVPEDEGEGVVAEVIE